MKKSQFKEYIIQILIVIIGVFLGMLASDWNSNKNLKKNRKAILNSIKNELNSNMENLESLEKSRKSFYVSHDSLSNILTEEILNERFFDAPFMQRLPNWKGLGNTSLEDAMFDAAKFSNIFIGMDIELLENLSKIYLRQKSMVSTHETLLDRFYNIDSNTKYKEVNRLIWQVRQELWGNQILLAKEYKKTIDLIEKKNK